MIVDLITLSVTILPQSFHANLIATTIISIDLQHLDAVQPVSLCES